MIQVPPAVAGVVWDHSSARASRRRAEAPTWRESDHFVRPELTVAEDFPPVMRCRIISLIDRGGGDGLGAGTTAAAAGRGSSEIGSKVSAVGASG